MNIVMYAYKHAYNLIDLDPMYTVVVSLSDSVTIVTTLGWLLLCLHP